VRSFTTLVCLLFSFSVFADKNKHHHQPSVFEVIPLNSPVKGSTAKFSLKLPTGFEVDKVKVKLVNANDLKKDQKKFEDITVTGNELNVGVSKLPPGFYRLYVKVWDKKNKAEHDFKTKFHDFVRFVIDESLQVPLPSEKENNKTLAGVDSDGDGIRDDIQRIINETFANKPNTKLAAKQLALAAQADLLQSIDVASTIIAMDKYSEALYCMDWVSPSATSQFSKKLTTLMRNTELRIKKSLQADQFYHGQGKAKSILVLERADPRTHSEKDYSPLCDFNAQKEE